MIIKAVGCTRHTFVCENSNQDRTIATRSDLHAEQARKQGPSHAKGSVGEEAGREGTSHTRSAE